MAVALLVAAGRGERLGSDGPKAFVVVGGKPLLEWSVGVLGSMPEIDRVVVALPDGVQAPPGTVGVSGGEMRSHSVRNALAAAGDGDPVIVHDAARPLVSVGLVRAVLAALEEDPSLDAAIAAARVTDTTKQAGEDGIVTQTLDRSSLWSVQTPQIFRRAPLERALAQPDDVLAAATDDASLVEEAGGRVRVVESPHWNPKVTVAADLRSVDDFLREC